jgi:hypothetical protein
MAAMKISHKQDIVLGCSVVASLTEKALNHQFEVLFKNGFIKPRLQFTAGDDDLSIDAELSAPTISLRGPGDQGKPEAILAIQLKSGTLTYYEGHGPKAKKVTAKIEGWTYGFRVNLDLKKLEHEDIEKHPAIPPEVREVLLAVPAAHFRIDHIFADIENANIALFDPERTNLPGLSFTQVESVKEILNAYFTSLKNWWCLTAIARPMPLGLASEPVSIHREPQGRVCHDRGSAPAG